MNVPSVDLSDNSSQEIEHHNSPVVTPDSQQRSPPIAATGDGLTATFQCTLQVVRIHLPGGLKEF